MVHHRHQVGGRAPCPRSPAPPRSRSMRRKSSAWPRIGSGATGACRSGALQAGDEHRHRGHRQKVVRPWRGRRDRAASSSRKPSYRAPSRRPGRTAAAPVRRRGCLAWPGSARTPRSIQPIRRQARPQHGQHGLVAATGRRVPPGRSRARCSRPASPSTWLSVVYRRRSRRLRPRDAAAMVASCRLPPEDWSSALTRQY